MAYYARKNILEDGCYFHVTWQCHNKSWLIKTEDSKQIYYNLLLKHKEKYGIQIYSYCFMSNHIHLVGKCEEVTKLSNYMKVVNSRFARLINEKLKRRGQVIMDRFKSPLIYTERDMLRVMRYLDLNPYRAKIVRHPSKYKWSSYGYYAYGKEDKLISESPGYMELGNNLEERQKVYIDIIDELIESEGGFNKEEYSVKYFIGDPVWAKQKYEQLKNTKQLFNRLE